jgi:hypothetical protein
MEYESQTVKNETTTFWNNAKGNILYNSALYPVPDLDREPETALESKLSQSRNRNRNRSLRFLNTVSRSLSALSNKTQSHIILFNFFILRALHVKILADNFLGDKFPYIWQTKLNLECEEPGICQTLGTYLV